MIKYIKRILVMLIIVLPIIYTVFFIVYLNQGQTTVVYHWFSSGTPTEESAAQPLIEKKEFVAPLGYVLLLAFCLGMIVATFARLIWVSFDYLEQKRYKRLEKKEEKKEKRYIEGIESFFQGDLDKAQSDFERVKGKNPEYISPYIRIADIYYRRKDFRKSLDFLDQARVNEAKRIDIFLRKAENFLALGDLGEAAAALDRAEELDPNNVTVLDRQRELHMRREQWEKASEAHEKYIRLSKDKRPEIQEIEHRLQYELAKEMLLSDGAKGRAIKTLERIVHEDPFFMPAQKLLGEHYIRQNKLDDAIKMWDKAYKKYPKNSTKNAVILTWMEDALLASETGAERIMEIYQKALDQSPDHRVIKLFYARFFLRVGKIEESERLIQELESEGASMPSLMMLKSELFAKKGDLKSSLKMLRSLYGNQMRNQVIFTCGKCFHEYPDWKDRCPNCLTWNRFQVNTGLELEKKSDATSVISG